MPLNPWKWFVINTAELKFWFLSFVFVIGFWIWLCFCELQRKRHLTQKPACIWTCTWTETGRTATLERDFNHLVFRLLLWLAWWTRFKALSVKRHPWRIGVPRKYWRRSLTPIHHTNKQKTRGSWSKTRRSWSFVFLFGGKANGKYMEDEMSAQMRGIWTDEAFEASNMEWMGA